MLWPILLAACSQTDTLDQDAQPVGAVSVSPVSHLFGEVVVFEQQTSTFQINNVGGGALTIYDIAFSDDSRRPHWQLAGGRSGVLAPGDVIDVDVFVRPVDLTDPAVDLLVRSDDPDNPEIVVSLSAQPVGIPQLRVEPAQLDLGSLPTNSGADSLIQIVNDGTAPLEVVAVSFVNEPVHFSLLADPAGEWVEPGSDGTIGVRFAPQAVGILTNRLLVETNDPDAPAVEVLLTGRGTP